MIYTVTFNPSLDYIVRLPYFHPGMVNRAEGEQLYPGGKGVNVSIVLSNLGIKSKALGFVAGFTGRELERLLNDYGCMTDFIHLNTGLTRINVKIKAGQESEINGQGPQITQAALERLYQKLAELKEGDVLVLAGSIPSSLPEDIYERILKKLADQKIAFVVDATKNLLANVLKYQPFLIKPNHYELGELFGMELQTVDEIVVAAKKVQSLGARNVLVSRARDGAVLVTEEGKILNRKPPDGKVVNSVGAGDSMVAGFLAGYFRTGDYEKALCLGLAAGSASAFQDWLANREDIGRLLSDPISYGL